VTFNLCADTASITMPDSVSVTIWGFGLDTGSGCTPQLPGPVLDGVTAGDTVVVNLTNNLAEPVSIVFPGQSLIPDTVGAAPAGGTTAYTFIASEPGTYLYESGTNYAVQHAMGLYGTLIVRPSTVGQAYNGAASAYDVEQVLVLSEIDPALNNETDPNDFNLLDYAPKYWLINGEAYPDTDLIPVGAGERLLLRYLNAGQEHHTLALLGAYQRVIAKDAFELPFPFDTVAETMAAGQTTDMIVTIPGSAAVGSRFPLYNRQLHLTNGEASSTPHFPGGMMTFIEVQTPSTQQADLAVTKADATDPVTVGDDVTYTVTVTNNGPDQADNVVLTDLLPAGMTLISTTGCAEDPAGVPTCTLGTIPASASVPVTIVVDTTTDGLKTNSVSVASTTSDPTPGNNSATEDTTVNPVAPPTVLYLSLLDNTTVNTGTLSVADEDILSFDGTNFSVLFDGSDVGVGGLDLDALQVVSSTAILMSFNNAGTIGSLGTVDDSDIVLFSATSLGDTTAGTFSLLFDGSDVGLTTDAEDVDAIEVIAGNQLAISTVGVPDLPGVSGEDDSDLFNCTGSFGPTTSCTWVMIFDGSDVGLTTDDEDVDGVTIDFATDKVYLTTFGNFSVTGVSGADEDVFVCTATGSTPGNTVCSYSATLFFDGSVFGLSGNDVDAISLP
jgi:uncharacterized repeat protein (TIGR01451 family)